MLSLWQEKRASAPKNMVIIKLRAVATAEELREPGPLLATSLSDLANLYVRQDRYAEAEKLYERALSIRERLLGPDDLDVAAATVGAEELADLQYLCN